MEFSMPRLAGPPDEIELAISFAQQHEVSVAAQSKADAGGAWPPSTFDQKRGAYLGRQCGERHRHSG
jgi:hypothetical protein